MKAITFPTGQPYSGPTDEMSKQASTLISTMTGIRSLLSEGIFISEDPNDRLNMMNTILPKALEADAVAGMEALGLLAGRAQQDLSVGQDAVHVHDKQAHLL